MTDEVYKGPRVVDFKPQPTGPNEKIQENLDILAANNADGLIEAMVVVTVSPSGGVSYGYTKSGHGFALVGGLEVVSQILKGSLI